MFKKVAILGRHEDPRVSEPITVLADYLTQAGVEVLASEDMSLEIPATRLPESDLAETADLIIAIGGDGAMLYAGQLARRGDAPWRRPPGAPRRRCRARASPCPSPCPAPPRKNSARPAAR